MYIQQFVLLTPRISPNNIAKTGIAAPIIADVIQPTMICIVSGLLIFIMDQSEAELASSFSRPNSCKIFDNYIILYYKYELYYKY